MSNRTHFGRSRRAGIALAAGFALGAVPVAAQAAPVDLGTARTFVVLGGSSVTNTGPSVLNGDLGVAPGTSLVGFGLPAVVNGATHNNNAVAGQAQADLTTAYNVAAAQPVAPANDLTGTNLGNRTLTSGAYRYTSDAGLTGALTLDAQGDPNAQFVFEIASALTTAPASSVLLVNGASPCNVYWQVGSSATLDTTTAFQGNLMALTAISLKNGASVTGRVLARNGGVSLINNVLNSAGCGSASTTSGGSTTGTTTDGAAGTGAGNGTGTGTTTGAGTATLTPGPRKACRDGFRARVRGRMIKRVDFSLDRRRIGSRVGSPFEILVNASPGKHKVSARVTFKDTTATKNMTFAFRACAARVLRPGRGPSRFTG